MQVNERLSLECGKVTLQSCYRIGFKVAAFCHPFRTETKTNPDSLACVFPCFLRQPHLMTLSFDWFTGLIVCFVIG